MKNFKNKILKIVSPKRLNEALRSFFNYAVEDRRKQIALAIVVAIASSGVFDLQYHMH